jgi:glycerol dehydrogenase-like iron-containing ADH family enzyme
MSGGNSNHGRNFNERRMIAIGGGSTIDTANVLSRELRRKKESAGDKIH